MAEREHGKDICDHLDCRAVRLIAARIGQYLDRDPACAAAVEVVKTVNKCSNAVALALIVNALTVEITEAVLAEAVAQEAEKIDQDWKELDG